MRIPQKRAVRSVRATQPSTPPSNVRSTGAQGTPGGVRAPSRKPGAGKKSTAFGVEIYLWILVGIEVALMGALRKYFRRHHGG
jgi:hypothetical protein